MFRFYNITLSNGQNDYILNYKIEEHRVAQLWASLVEKTSPLDLRPNLNPWRGVDKNYAEKVEYLNTLIKRLNTWISTPIKHLWDINNPHDSLNKLHIHFPDEEKKTKDIDKLKQLTEYNDLIHEISGILISKKNNRKNLHLLLCSRNENRYKLENDDFKLFNVKFKFGDIKLHYCHVGRHPLELYINNDINCPEDQILPQYEISTFHTLTFFNMEITPLGFKKFYYESKIKWPYKYDDPKLAFGYINVGKLISVNDKILNEYEIKSIVESCSKVIAWSIFN